MDLLVEGWVVVFGATKGKQYILSIRLRQEYNDVGRRLAVWMTTVPQLVKQVISGNVIIDFERLVFPLAKCDYSWESS